MAKEQQRTIVFLDDSATVRKVADRCLTSAGYRVVLASTGIEGRISALGNRPDLVIVDASLLDETGIDVCVSFLKEKTLASIPVVLLSGSPEKARNESRDLPNVVGVLKKPFDQESIVGAIQQELDRADRQREECASLRATADEIAKGDVSCGRPSSGNTAARRVVDRIARGIRERLAETLREGVGLSKDELARSVSVGLLSPDFLSSIGSDLDCLVGKSSGARLIADGDIMSFADVLQSLSNRQVVGVLGVEAGRTRVDLHLSDGMVRFIDIPRVDWGQQDVLYSSGHAFPKSLFEEVARSSSMSDGFHSVFLRVVTAGELPASVAQSAMVSLSIDLLRDCIDEGRECRFSFNAMERLASFGEIDLRMPTQRFLLKLFSRMDEWKVILEEIRPHASRFHSTDKQLNSLDSELKRIREAVTGVVTVPQLSESCRLSAFEICRGLHALEQLGAVEIERESCPEL